MPKAMPKIMTAAFSAVFFCSGTPTGFIDNLLKHDDTIFSASNMIFSFGIWELSFKIIIAWCIYGDDKLSKMTAFFERFFITTRTLSFNNFVAILNAFDWLF